MSSHEYRAELTQAIGLHAEDYTARLVQRREDGLGEMRFNQGVLAGLSIALEIERDVYRKLVGG